MRVMDWASREVERREGGIGERWRWAEPAEPEAADLVEADAVKLRRHAWDIGTRRAHEAYAAPQSFVTLAAVTPTRGFVTWRIDLRWIDETARQRQESWHNSTMVLRVYDVSYLIFNGLNAHRIRDITLYNVAGHAAFSLPHPGTFQLAEVGFRLRTGEFVPGARSETVQFPVDSVARTRGTGALYVDETLRVEPVASPWEAIEFLRERRKPRLRPGLRIALLASESLAGGGCGVVGTFVSSLAGRLQARGLRPHLFVPATAELAEDCCVDGVQHHPLEIEPADGPVGWAAAYARAAEASLRKHEAFDLLHCSEWLTALVPWLGARPTVLSLTSLESIRRGQGEETTLSREIQKIEREVACVADRVLVPPWLRGTALAELGFEAAKVHAFPLDGRAARDWDVPLEAGEVKAEIDVGRGCRLLTFVGPIEHSAGPDILLEAMPAILARAPDVRLAMVGVGGLVDSLRRRAQQLGIGHSLRWLGHVDGRRLARLMRVSVALVLPSRQRIAFDESLVGLGRRGARPVITTHAGPAQLVRHDEDGLVAYGHAGSLAWAVGQLLEDPSRVDAMGERGRQRGDEVHDWTMVAELYGDLCSLAFPALAERRI